MTIFLSEHDAARLGLSDAKPRTKRGRTTRPDLPSAGRAASTGLTGLIAPNKESGKPAWSITFNVRLGYRLYVIGQPTMDTGFVSSERAACDAAKALL